MNLHERALEVTREHFPGLEPKEYTFGTNNPVYTLNEGEKPRYCLKIQRPGMPEKERRVTEFYNRFGISSTLGIAMIGEDYLVTEFDEELKYGDARRAGRGLAEIHEKLLDLNPEMFPTREKIFRSQERRRKWQEIVKGRNTIDAWIPSDEAILIGNSLTPTPPQTPSILLHGDAHSGNVGKNKKDRTIAYDFEFARIGTPSNDVARALLTEGVDNLEKYLEGYLERMPEIPGIETEEQFLETVWHDLIMEGTYTIIRTYKRNPLGVEAIVVAERFRDLYNSITGR